ncbi:hypothetical protein HGRIS_004184 [Hohenbuehelia grisea]|uniref:Amino acid permease/ SLC12A domain-containing protein n=1 Tax=Hohenbuehelia grisea TaxID=104357 RepID=A0ABR3JHQ8_9AGAR
MASKDKEEAVSSALSEKADNVAPPISDLCDEEKASFSTVEHDGVHDGVKRQLKQRHVQMIAIAGTIGTGLFLGSGGALRAAGPLGALMAYGLVGTVAYASLCSVAEMTTWAPISGSYPYYASRWVDPAFGFAVGWNSCYSLAISLPGEITAATILLTFWDHSREHLAAYTAAIAVLVITLNVFGVKYFGESEFYFSLIKISLIIGLILCGLVIDLGGAPNHDRIGFRYWKEPGALARANLVPNLHTDRFLAFISVVVQAAYSFQGMELIAVAASETESPRRNIAKAVHRVFYRILIFYIFGILIIGMCVPYNDTSLLQATGNAAQSPFVIAINRAGIKVLPHIINAAIFTSAFSAANSSLYCGSRILYGLALRGQAPPIFSYCTKRGLPLPAVAAIGSFCLLAFMNAGSGGGEKAFDWLVHLTTTGGFIGWLALNVTYARFWRGMTVQGYDLRKNVYHSRLQPYLSYWGIFWTSSFILISGFKVFFKFNFQDFLASYINIPLFLALFLGYRWSQGTKFRRAEDMDLVTGIPSIEETEVPEVPPQTIGEKIAAVVF